jgi:hypothetical protein
LDADDLARHIVFDQLLVLLPRYMFLFDFLFYGRLRLPRGFIVPVLGFRLGD